MNKTKIKLVYPENAYCDIFGGTEFVNMPLDAEKTLLYVMKTLPQREADLFMLKHKDKMTLTEIGKKYNGISRERVRQIIDKAKRKLRYPIRSKILLIGCAAYFNSGITQNNEKKMQDSNEFIADLHIFLKKQIIETTDYQDKLIDFNIQIHSIQDVFNISIDDLNLSTRLRNILRRYGMKTIKDVLDYENLYKIRNMGQISIQEVQNKITTIIKSNQV